MSSTPARPASPFGFRARAAALLARAEESLSSRVYDVRSRGGSGTGVPAMPGEAEANQRNNLALEPGEALAITSFPGWAALRGSTDAPRVDVLVHGYATKSRPLERASRSQRVFMAATRSLVGLAKLPAEVADKASQAIEAHDENHLRPEIAAGPAGVNGRRDPKNEAFTHLLELSPEDAEAELERELMALELSERQSDIHPPAPRSSNSSRQSSISVGSASDAADLSVLHANLRERLRGFLAQKLGGRHVRVTVRDGSPSGPMLSTGLLLTGEDGTFRHTLPILVPAGERWEGRKLVVECELQLEPAEERGVERTGDSLTDASSLEIFPTGSIRVVSDLDDTVKHTQVLAGTRQILRNVFTRPYDEVCVAGMRDWYQAMAEVDGKRSAFQLDLLISYVSNSPYELASVVRAFIAAAGLPPGQLILKLYARGTGLLSGLWQPAGARKRQNVESILSAFPDSRFVLVGDSGEQDLELYVELAALHPTQVLAVFIRDVTTPLPIRPLTDRGPRALHDDSSDEAIPVPSTRQSPVRTSSQPSPRPDMTISRLTSGPTTGVDNAAEDSLSPNNPLAAQSTPVDKLVQAFHARISAAERALPDGVVLRIFRDGHEVAEEGVEIVRQALRSQSWSS